MYGAEKLIWRYIGEQYDDFGLIPSFDDVMCALEGELHIDDLPLINEVTFKFIQIHEMEGVVING